MERFSMVFKYSVAPGISKFQLEKHICYEFPCHESETRQVTPSTCWVSEDPKHAKGDGLKPKKHFFLDEPLTSYFDSTW
jgi:hypothetical protein